MKGEACLEARVEAHVVHGLVHRLFDQQAVIVGSSAMRRAKSSVRSEQLGFGKIFDHHPGWYAFLGAERVAGEHQLLGLAGVRTPRVGEVPRPHMPSLVPTTSANSAFSGRHDQVARPHQHQARAKTGPCTWAMVIFAQVRQAQRVGEVVVHSWSMRFSAPAGCRRRRRTSGADLDRGASQPASPSSRGRAGGEHRAVPPRMTTRTSSSASGGEQRLVELDEQARF